MNSTILEPGISFSLDQENGVPIYRQVIQQIEYAILSGRMSCGDKLPTIRSLAVELRINPNTIAKAYNELEIRGIVSTQVGSGTFISDKKPEGEADVRKTKILGIFHRFIQDMADLGVDRADVAEMCRSLEAGIKEK
ncbi:MAG: GntR family transcriptional regulator [Treponema sp.]|jgi:GntR family transcriptional regulator|nr:GntR family transcriptional regulator [Treponema sp.]